MSQHIGRSCILRPIKEVVYPLIGLISDLNPNNRTLPEAQPIARVCFLIIELTGRYSEGSQRTLVPFQLIQDRLAPGEYSDQRGIWLFTVIEPRSVIRCASLGLKDNYFRKLLILSVCCSAPVSALQSRTVLSPKPDASRRPSSENDTDQTQSVWRWTPILFHRWASFHPRWALTRKLFSYYTHLRRMLRGTVPMPCQMPLSNYRLEGNPNTPV